jgi:tRNA-(ms[2]io[6]A)-hydroxylase
MISEAILTSMKTADADQSALGDHAQDGLDVLGETSLTQPHPIDAVLEFLGCVTPDAWVAEALKQIPLLLQDHANCEKKAAGTAMNLMFRYEVHRELQIKLAQLVREEMLHYEQVLGLMQERSIEWQHVSAGRYAAAMIKHKRTHEPEAMVDVLIIGAFIEARSCERFSRLSGLVSDGGLARYYGYLLKSESRHFKDYLALAAELSAEPITERVALFREIEADLIQGTDPVFRFHSGVPA